MEELKWKKARVKSDIANLHDSANGLLLKGETEESQAHKYLVQVNSFAFNCKTESRRGFRD